MQILNDLLLLMKRKYIVVRIYSACNLFILGLLNERKGLGFSNFATLFNYEPHIYYLKVLHSIKTLLCDSCS